jgi:hypothetical protein
MRALAISTFFVALAGCATPARAPVNSDFSPPPAVELARGFELRERYNLPKHIGGTAIFVDSVAVHHFYDEASTIAWRDETGRWQWSQAREIGPGGLLRIERSLEANETRTLTDAEARSLEHLIRNPRTYSGEVRRTGWVGIGSSFHAMAIVTPFGRTLVRWDGRLRGPSGQVADIILGHE